MTETRTRSLLWGAIVASCVPIALVLHQPASITTRSATLHLSAIAGYVGIVLLLWMYILGAKSVMSLVFHDLAPILGIHKKLGKWGSLLIVLHPVLIVYSYGESLLYSIVPHLDTEFERHVTLGRIAFGMLLLTWVLSVYFRKRLGFRPWKYLHYLAYICVPFALLHVPDVGSQFMSYSSVKIYYFLLIVVFFIFTLIRIRSLFNLDKQPYTIKGNKKIGPDDYLLWLRPQSTALSPRRGQYVYLKTGYISEDHPFSMTQYRDDIGDLYLTYRVFGEFTDHLSTLKPGKTVFVGGPFGRFTSHIDAEPAAPVVYISGGIGITPFVDRIISEHSEREQWLFAANRTPQSAVLVSTVAPVLGPRCISVYSETTVRSKSVESGYITADILGRHLTDPSRFSYYICGPNAMMAAVRTTLRGMGIPDTHIHSETFGW